MRQLLRTVIQTTTDSILKRPATTGSPVLERQLHFDPTGRAQMERFAKKFESGSDHRLAEVDLVPIGTFIGPHSSAHPREEFTAAIVGGFDLANKLIRAQT